MSKQSHPLVQRAVRALAADDLPAARAAIQERLQADSHDLLALQVRATIERREGASAQAAETLKAVLKIDPRADWAYNELIELLFLTGRRGDAEQLARLALRVNPGNAEAHNLFGTILSELNDLPAGEWHFRRALALGAVPARATANLALNLMQQGRTEEAAEQFAAAHALAPGDFRTLAHWSKLHEVRGELDRAGELLDRAQAAGSPGQVNLLRANHLARIGRPLQALQILEGASRLNGDALLQRGRLLDSTGRYEEAWSDFTAGKAALAAEAGGLSYPPAAVDDFFARLKRFFTAERIALLPHAPRREDVPQPIFIMGFPRSGTTLIEQVLTSHPAVRPGGELSFIAEFRTLVNQLLGSAEPFPDNLARAWTADQHHLATVLRDHYFARAAQAGLLSGGHRCFTDKMPFNEIWLPVLRMAFPHARIVHVVRHPLDVCVSIMANNMTHGFNCGYAIESVVHHLAAVGELLEHYRTQLPETTADHVLAYESFVTAQRGATERLLAHVQLPFDERCVTFHENRRYARTPSYAQVTEKLNDRSIGRHLHYARPLQPFAAVLAPLVARHRALLD